MSLPGNGIFVVKGEMSLILTAMRRGNRWSSNHHHHQEDDQDPLIETFQELKNLLNKIEDLRLIEPNEFLAPFLEVIRSEDTTGPVTSLALSAVNKFLSYGLIDPTHNSVPLTVHNIADAVTHARFVGTDQSSDGVVLMKILQVLKTLTLSPEGASLTNESLCDIMLSCFKICFETRLNELLRRTAEHYLKDMIQLVFMRLPQFPEVFTGNFKQLKMRPGNLQQETRSRKKSKVSYRNKTKQNDGKSIDKPIDGDETPLLNKTKINATSAPISPPPENIVDMQGSISQASIETQSLILDKSEDGSESITNESVELQLNADANSKLTESIESGTAEDVIESEVMVAKSDEVSVDYVNQRGIRFTQQHPDEMALIPYGLACVYELFRFLISLCNPLDKQNTDIMIHLGLTLLTTAFEVGADCIGKYSSLLALVKDELCRNLFSLLSTERLSVFAADLQVSFLMFEALRTHLKFQLEFYLTKLIEIVTNDASKITYEHKEIALDNILQLWRIPGFTTELYLNYDCDMYCTNLFEDLTKLLAKNIINITAGVYNTHLLSLDALLTVVESIEMHCNEKNEVNAVECERLDTVVTDESSDTIENIQSIIGKGIRQKVSDNVPTRDDLIAIKNIKKWLPTGTEYFNHKPKKGIQFLQEHNVLKSDLDPYEICVFLRENPSLDKKMIGEYISGRSNFQVLEAFVKLFDFTETRLDEALRLYLETFRLPGEAPLISLLLEHFAEHWHKCNGEPFTNADAAFTLAYAIIMLNVDQHNHNVKRQNIPMSAAAFKKNLKQVNGGKDFDQDMLDEIYTAIKNEEIVMPAEQTGLVRENYLWKVLLRRGASKDGHYIHVNSDAYDMDLFQLIWGPIVAALSFVFDKSDDYDIYKKALQGFKRCAFISANFGITTNLDMLLTTLSKYTMLHNQPKTHNLQTLFGGNIKAQLALIAVFALAHQHGDNIREGWKTIFDLVHTLYSLAMLPKSYIEAEDFIEASGKIQLIYENIESPKQDTGLFSSLYSYMVSSENINRNPNQEERECIDQAHQCIRDCYIEQAITDSKFLNEEALDALVHALIELSRGPELQKSLGFVYNENVAVFFLELLVKIVLQNRDRVMTIWQMVRDHLYTLVMNASHCDYQFLLERSVIGLLRLAIRLMRNEEMSPIVLQSLQMLLLLKSHTLYKISRQISFGLYELLKTSAQNIHTSTDWSIIFTLLECVGAGAQPPKAVVDDTQTDQGAKSDGEAVLSSEEEVVNTDRGYSSESELNRSPKHMNVLPQQQQQQQQRSQSPIIMPVVSPIGTPQNNAGGWILVGNEGEIQPVVGRTPPAHQYSLALERNLGQHDPYGLVKCCESLAFLVRDVAHITPYNFDNCVHCIRTFVEASLHENKTKRGSRTRRKSLRKRTTRSNQHSPASSPDELEQSDDETLPTAYHQVTIQLLDLMHTLHTRTAQIFRWWAEEGGEVAQEISLWTQGWCPLLQGIARLCCDPRKPVRMTAITYLQRALLVHDLQTLTGPEWEACFNRVLFPLLNQLLQPIQQPDSSAAMEETRMRAATVLSKVFLHHLTPLLSLDTFPQLWISILDYMDRYMHADRSDLLAEAIPESIKNMLLVMESAGVFQHSSQLWLLTWERIGTFLPHMKEELFKEKETSSSTTPTLATAVTTTAVVSSSREEEVVVCEEFPKSSSIQVTQHNIENATRSSIILQPPTSQTSMNSPLFAHLGQMVSTPIGPPNVSEVMQTPPLSHSVTPTAVAPPPVVVAAAAVSPTTINPHTFPILYGASSTSTTADEQQQQSQQTVDAQPVSLYADFLDNPYTLQMSEHTFQNRHGGGNAGVTLFPNDATCNSSHRNDSNYSYTNLSADVVTHHHHHHLLHHENNNHQENVFQSANYFVSSNEGNIPPGSEILFGTNLQQHYNNIPNETN